MAEEMKQVQDFAGTPEVARHRSAAMGPIPNYDQHAQRLIEPNLSVQMVMEVRDSLEIAHTSEYLNFLQCYFRAFSVILTHITTPQMTENVEHKLRNVVVEILNRLPHSEVLRPFVQDLLKLSLQVLTQDNEDNALISICIIFDIIRNFRPTIESKVQHFIDFICAIYQSFPSTVKYFFEQPISSNTSASNLATAANVGSNNLIGGGGPGAEDGTALLDVSQVLVPFVGIGLLNPSTRSFKIVAESPLVEMFLFQLYNKLVQTNIPYLPPYMVSAILIPGLEKVHPHLKTQFVELKGAQVKSFDWDRQSLHRDIEAIGL